MNKLRVLPLFAALGLIFLAMSSATAATIYESFLYSNGALAGNTNATAPASINGFPSTNVWTATANANNAQVVSGDLTYSGLPTTNTGHIGQVTDVGNGNPVRLGIGEYPEGSTVYVSMLVQIPATSTTYGTSNTTGSFFGGFQYNPSTISGATMSDTTAGAGGVLLIRRVGAAAPGSGYNLGVGFRDTPSSTGTPNARIFDATHEYHAGDTVFLVEKYEIKAGGQNDVATLYLNPDPTLGEASATANAVSDASVILAASTTNYDYMWSNAGVQLETKIRSFFLRSNTVEPTNINIDEVRIGASWEEATGQLVVVVPEPATIGILGIAAAGLLAHARRRR